MAQDPKDAQAADADANKKEEKGMSFQSLIKAAKDKKNEMAASLEKLDKETTDIPTLMSMALKGLVAHEKRLNDIADSTEGKLNLLSQYAKAKGVIYVHSWKVGVGLVGASYGRGILMIKGDAGWSLPLAVTKPEVKLGPQVASVSEDQIILLPSEKNVKSFVTGKTPNLTVGVDAFLAYGDKGASVSSDNQSVSSNDQKGYGGGSTIDFGTFRDFVDANEKFYGKKYDKDRILSVSPDMDNSDLVKAIGKDKLETTKKFIEILTGFQVAAQDEMAKKK